MSQLRFQSSRSLPIHHNPSALHNPSNPALKFKSSSVFRPKFRTFCSHPQSRAKIQSHPNSTLNPKPSFSDGLKPVTDDVSRGELIRSYVDDGFPSKAAMVFVEMLERGFPFEKFQFFPSLIKGFGDFMDVKRVREIHVHLLKLGFLEDVYVVNSLLGAFWKCGESGDAVKLFDKMPEKVSVSWNTMVSGFSRSGDYTRSLRAFSLMFREHGIVPNRVACVSGLTACSALESRAHGREIHGFVVKNGFDDEYVVSGLMDLYMKCGDVKNARRVFDIAMDNPSVRVNTVIWNVMILGCVSNGHLCESVRLVLDMLSIGVRLDSSTVVAVLVLCAELSDIELGKQAHGLAIGIGVDNDVRVEMALIDMYFKCGDAKSGTKIFKQSSNQNGVVWGTMILNYAQSGFPMEALDLFREYRLVSVFVDPAVVVSALRACSSLATKSEGMEIHGLVVKFGFGSDVFIGGALADMYVKSRDTESAQKVLYNLPNRDSISWSALIVGLAQNSRLDEALKSFRDMQSELTRPNTVTIACVLSACAGLSAMTLCKEIHAHSLRRGFGCNVLINNSLISSYAKCGDIRSSSAVFYKMPERDEVSWNSILLGLSVHGKEDEIFSLFKEMDESGMKPDHATFSAVLSACSHWGRVEEGLVYFRSMVERFKIEPQLEQYTCMVDLLGRAGNLRQAFDLISAIPCDPDERIWGSLLAACKVHGDEELAEVVADRIVRLVPSNISYRVVLSNLYEDIGKWNEVNRVRTEIRETGLKKSPGCSWIEVENGVHSFMAGDRSHDQSGEIYDALESLTVEIRKAGYVPRATVAARLESSL